MDLDRTLRQSDFMPIELEQNVGLKCFFEYRLIRNMGVCANDRQRGWQNAPEGMFQEIS